MRNRKKILQAALILTAVVLIGLGIQCGGYRDTWSKATRICFECIGIG